MPQSMNAESRVSFSTLLNRTAATIAAMPNASARLYLSSTTIPAITTGRITMLCTVPCFHPFFRCVRV